MDSKGKAGSLLLLLGSALALCPNVASHPACLKGAKCQVILQDLYDIASSLSSLMYIRSVVLFQEFERVYAQDPLYFVAAISMCDTTTHIPISTANDDLKEMQTEDIIRVMFRLLSSCDDPLKHLAQEAHRLPKFNHSLTFSVRILSDEIRKLQELTKQIVHQFHPDMTLNMDSALWPGLQSLQSSDEEPRLFAFYNTLRCLKADFQKILVLFKYLNFTNWSRLQ